MAADSKSAGDWAAAMQKAQSDLLRQWTEMSQAWARAASGGLSPAAGAASGAAPTGAQPGAAPGGTGTASAAESLARGFLRQTEQYLGVSRALWELVGKSATVADPEQRARTFAEGLNGLQQQFAGLWAATPFGAPQGPAASAALSGNPFGFPGFPGWPGTGAQGMGAGLPGFPGFGGFPGIGGFPGVGGLPGAGNAFGLPSLGPAREQQESWQRLMQLGARCGQAQVQLSAQWNDIIGKALRELGERLAPRLKSGAPPGSMKEIYDLWVDSAESVYAQAARGADYVQAQAELTNSLSQLRAAQRDLIEEWGKQFDLPTRAELNSIHQQLRDLKAALAAARG